MKYSLKWLLGRISENEKIKYLFFWGHHPLPNNTITSSCFSQWWDLHPFIVDNIKYRTTEHWMMAEKARLFEDEIRLQKILAAKSPGEAKKLGREVLNFNQELWLANRDKIVIQGNKHKFSQHADLNEFLQATKDRVLVEASPIDNIWGIGLAKYDPNAEHPEKWKGLNLLGFALMEVRDALSSETR